MKNTSCVTLIGMPGTGKSTIGKPLAAMLEFAFIDSDLLIESFYARRLQDITDEMSREQFLDTECAMLLALRASACVIATGGSAIYRAAAMQHLRSLGPIVHLTAPLDEIARRVAQNPERGICAGPGQSLADLYEERMRLYEFHADLVCDTSAGSPHECAAWIKNSLAGKNLVAVSK